MKSDFIIQVIGDALNSVQCCLVESHQPNALNCGHVSSARSVGTTGISVRNSLVSSVFSLSKEICRHCWVAQFAENAHWAESSPLFAHRARPTPLKCKNEYPVLPLGEETAVQAVVGSIAWTFRRLKKPRCREMSARGYMLHSVCPQLSFESDI